MALAPEPPAPAATEAWPPLFATAPAVEAVETELRVAAPEEPAPEPWTPASARTEEPAMVAPIATGRPSRSRGSGAGRVLAVLLVVLVVLIGIFLGARTQIVRAAPAMGGVYKTLGLPAAASPPGR
ncbi:MAG TPA: hypothetical protein VGH03_15215 [Caulobacteraceae bacterium]|jgi:hypothetical protein